MDRLLISHQVDLGNGLVQVHFRTRGGQMANVVIGWDGLQDGTVYPVMERHAEIVDSWAASSFLGRSEHER